MSMHNWNIGYTATEDGETCFVESMQRGDHFNVTSGKAFTFGTSNIVADRPDMSSLTNRRDWIYDACDPEWHVLESEIDSAIQHELDKGDINGLLIHTDSSLMTIGLITHYFEDVATAEDDDLWMDESWDNWIDNPNLDPAYRWMLAYGFNADGKVLPHEVYYDNVIRVFNRCLSKIPDTCPVRYISISADDTGHQLSECMGEELTKRMLSWLG